MKIIPLFSTPCYIENIERINHKNIIQKLEKVEYDVVGSNNAMMSKSDHILDDHLFFKLKEKILEKFDNFIYNHLNFENIKFYINNSWVNLHCPGHWGQVHYHPNSFYSGVYYPQKIDQETGFITFSCPDTYPTYISTNIDPKIKEYNIINSRKWSISLEEGDVMFFPSHLLHEVTQNLSSDQKRFSIAFNFWIDEFIDERRSKYLKIK